MEISELVVVAGGAMREIEVDEPTGPWTLNEPVTLRHRFTGGKVRAVRYETDHTYRLIAVITDSLARITDLNNLEIVRD